MRIRTIKPEFWSHPIMGRISERAQLLALALLNHADDHGYFHADPAIIRGACAPFRENLATISEDLARLSEVGWIELRDHPEQGSIGLVVNWTKHQKVDHPKASKIEAYFIRENLAKPRDKLALDQGSGIRDQGGEASPPAAPVVTRPKDHWRYVQLEPWVSRGKRAGCTISAGNFESWQGAIERTGGDTERFFKHAEGMPADKRWHDKIEASLMALATPKSTHGPKWLAWLAAGGVGAEPEANE
jgi:hypothetical protein